MRPGSAARRHADHIVVATPCRLAATDTAMTRAIRAGASEPTRAKQCEQAFKQLALVLTREQHSLKVVDGLGRVNGNAVLVVDVP
jgi:hypothetical protein